MPAKNRAHVTNETLAENETRPDPARIPGWFRRAEADKIAAGCRSLRPGAFVEIGTWCGRSTAMLAALLPDWTIWTVDSYKRDAVEFWGADLPRHPRALAAENLAGIPNVRRIVADSLDAKLIADIYPDALLIDGDHTRERVALELRHWLPRFNPAAGFAWLHDRDWPGVRQGVKDGMAPEWRRVRRYEAGDLWCFGRQ